MKKGPFLKVAAIVVASVLLDIAAHIVTSAFSTMPENPNLSPVQRILGTEITASLWAVCAFSGVAFVYLKIRDEIPGEGVKKGLRYGSAIALLWMFAMLEGVSLFGNPVINEFVVGLSDAIPVFMMSILLSKLKTEKVEKNHAGTDSFGQKIRAVLIFAGIFLAGRYIAYLSGVITSGNQTRPLHTFIWTLFMGISIGSAFVILGSSKNGRSFVHRAVKFGLFIFGINWAVFLLFMPLLFSGYILDVSLRILIDTALMTIASYLAVIPKGELLKKQMLLRKYKVRRSS